MPTEIVLLAGGATTRRGLDGPTTLGGSRADGIAVDGLPPGAVRLEPCAPGLIVRPTAPGLRVAGHPVAPGTCRLLRPGERASFRGCTLELSGAALDGPTRVAAAAVLRGAFGGAGPRGPHLVVLTGAQAGERAAIAQDLVIGRGRAAGLRLRDPAASRRHARVRLGPGGATVEDLGAKNRLRLNGVRAERRPLPLRAGDRITIGETDLAFDDGRPVAAAARRPPSPAPSARPPAPTSRALLAGGLLAASAAALSAMASCGG